MILSKAIWFTYKGISSQVQRCSYAHMYTETVVPDVPPLIITRVQLNLQTIAGWLRHIKWISSKFFLKSFLENEQNTSQPYTLYETMNPENLGSHRDIAEPLRSVEHDYRDDINNTTPGPGAALWLTHPSFLPSDNSQYGIAVPSHWLAYWVTTGHTTKEGPSLLWPTGVSNEDKPKLEGGAKQEWCGEGRYQRDSTWLISRTQVSRFSVPLPGDCCQGNRVRGKSGSQKQWGRPPLAWQHQPRAPNQHLYCCDNHGSLESRGHSESLLTFGYFPLLLLSWPRCQALQACSHQLA